MKIVILRLKLMRKIVEMNEIVKNSSKQVILVKKSTINEISKQWLEPLGSAQYFDEPLNSRVFGLGRLIKRFGLIWVWFIGLHACPSFWVNIELQSLHIFNVVQYSIVFYLRNSPVVLPRCILRKIGNEFVSTTIRSKDAINRFRNIRWWKK